MPIRLRLLCCLLVAATLGLSSCGVRDDHTAGAADGDDEASLPTLPPVDEELPGVYDENGCLILADGEVDCEASADVVDEALAGGEGEDNRTLAGFVGPLFTTDVSADALVVLDDTVAVGAGATWSAQGLIRNETTGPAVRPVVTGVLRDGSGAEVATVEAEVAVRPLRSGEPAPFRVESDVAVAAVASVDWSVADAGGEPPPGTRDLAITTYSVAPAGDREPLALYLYTESGPGPHPYVLFGSVTDEAGIEAPDPLVLAAWLDEAGRVRALAEAQLGDPDDPVEVLRPDRLADFVLSVGGPAAAGLDSSQILLWAVSR